MRTLDVIARGLTLSTILLISACGLIRAQTEDLFNGKDLTGWTIYGTELWYVEDGLLVCESGPDEAYGYFGTNRDFENFELTLEFKQGQMETVVFFSDPQLKEQKLLAGKSKWHLRAIIQEGSTNHTAGDG